MDARTDVPLFFFRLLKWSVTPMSNPARGGEGEWTKVEKGEVGGREGGSRLCWRSRRGRVRGKRVKLIKTKS